MPACGACARKDEQQDNSIRHTAIFIGRVYHISYHLTSFHSCAHKQILLPVKADVTSREKKALFFSFSTPTLLCGCFIHRFSGYHPFWIALNATNIQYPHRVLQNGPKCGGITPTRPPNLLPSSNIHMEVKLPPSPPTPCR